MLDRLANDPSVSVVTALVSAFALKWEGVTPFARSVIRERAGGVPDSRARYLMSQMLAVSDGVPAERAAALSALSTQWLYLDAELRNFVGQRLPHEPNARVRETAVKSLGGMRRRRRGGRRGRARRPVPPRAGGVRDLISILEDRATQDSAASVRAAAIVALTQSELWFDRSDVRSFVRERARCDSSESVRAAARRRLGVNE
jgi:hypothetical protein